MSAPVQAGGLLARTWPTTTRGASVERARPERDVSIQDPNEPHASVLAAPPAPPAIPKRFMRVSFETFEPDTPALQDALAATRGFVAAAIAGRPTMLALVGSQGTGKSHLLYAAVHALIAQGQKVYSRPWYRLADELRYGGHSPFNERTELESQAVRRMLWAQRIIVLDEVRPTAGTSFDDTELAKLSCHAYDQELAVLMTTNVNPLADVMGPAAASRYVPLVIEGRDRRRGDSDVAGRAPMPSLRRVR